MKENTPDFSDDAKRIQGFSDGIFGFAITLLVLELIEILHAKNGESLLKLCFDHWQSFVAFTIGFITILVCWINHHVAFEYITRVDIKLMWINGFLLFVVTLTPFPTAILAEYLATESTIALAIFGFNYILISVAAYSICSYAYNNGFVKEEYREFYSAYKSVYLYAIFYNIIAFLLCFVSMVVPIILYTLLFAVFAMPKEFALRLYTIKINRKNKLQGKGN